MQFAPGSDHLFVSSSSDNSLAVWDLKSLDGKGKFKSIASAVHPKTCQSAYFAPDGELYYFFFTITITLLFYYFYYYTIAIYYLCISHSTQIS